MILTDAELCFERLRIKITLGQKYVSASIYKSGRRGKATMFQANYTYGSFFI